MKHWFLLSTILTITAWAAPATSLAGKWSGTIDVHDRSGADISTPVSIQLEQPSPNAATGTIGREGEPAVPIQNAKITGDTLTFEAGNEETTGPMKFEVHIQGDRMIGNMKGTIDVEPVTGKVELTRQK